MDKLTRFILATGGERWRMGATDCCPWLLRWAMEATGGRDVPPIYKTRKEALQLIQDAGGLSRLLAPFCDRLGLEEIEYPNWPKRGDIAVIAHKQALSNETVGIATGNGFCVRLNENGFGKNTIIKARYLKAWRVNAQE